VSRGIDYIKSNASILLFRVVGHRINKKTFGFGVRLQLRNIVPFKLKLIHITQIIFELWMGKNISHTRIFMQKGKKAKGFSFVVTLKLKLKTRD
jgi:hypothetical protein